MIGVTSAFKWLGDKVVSAVLGDIDRRMVAAGNRGLAVMHSLAPVKTGFLRSQEDFTVVDRTLVFSFGAPYDIFTEFGTRHMMARPHIRPGLNAIGTMLGFDAEMHFNVPVIHQPILAYPRRNVLFQTPPTLTKKQLHHVRKDLVPVSSRLHKGNVKRAKMTVRRFD